MQAVTRSTGQAAAGAEGLAAGDARRSARVVGSHRPHSAGQLDEQTLDAEHRSERERSSGDTGRTFGRTRPMSTTIPPTSRW